MFRIFKLMIINNAWYKSRMKYIKNGKFEFLLFFFNQKKKKCEHNTIFFCIYSKCKSCSRFRMHFYNFTYTTIIRMIKNVYYRFSIDLQICVCLFFLAALHFFDDAWIWNTNLVSKKGWVGVEKRSSNFHLGMFKKGKGFKVSLCNIYTL